ncbi:MAG: hypothetical protein ABI906_10090 [Pseudomonadota bacterium]
MQAHTLLRLAGAVALLGGVLRIVAVFAPELGGPLRVQGVYLTVDTVLLLGVIGIWGEGARRLGKVGAAEFVLSVAGVCVVRSQAAFGLGAYAAGASLFGVGMAAIGGRMLVDRAAPRLGPALWIATLIVGALGPLLADEEKARLAAGIVFALGFIAAGLSLMRSNSLLLATPGSRPNPLGV